MADAGSGGVGVKPHHSQQQSLSMALEASNIALHSMEDRINKQIRVSTLIMPFRVVGVAFGSQHGVGLCIVCLLCVVCSGLYR